MKEKIFTLSKEEIDRINDPIQSPTEKKFVGEENKRILEKVLKELKESNNDFRSI